MENQLITLAQNRRSIYALGRHVTLSEAQVTTLIQDAIKWAPTPFNNQTTRAVILWDSAHEKLWDIVRQTLRQVVTDDQAFAQTAAKLAGFKNALGTVLFYTDTAVVQQFAKDFPTYADNFGDWSEQAQGGAQYAVWTALAENQIGANLQHYNPLIDDQVRQAFNVPATWRLRAEMDFGSIEAPAGEKTFMPDDQRFLTFK